jgi:hypothetical protein
LANEGKSMCFRLDDKIKLPRHLIVLLALVFVVWTAGVAGLSQTTFKVAQLSWPNDLKL